jgi:predicted phosphodiesterase
MKILRRRWHGVARPDTWTLYPLGDVHLGNQACDEKLFRATVKRVAEDDSALWLGMGDYCDFINLSDPRFDPASLSPWVTMADIGDLAGAQARRFLEIVEPIAHKCLGLVEGNHERAIQKHYERSIYSDIVTGVKLAGGFPVEHQLAFGYAGWLMMHFYQHESKNTTGHLLRVSLHHGFVGGKLAGAKALNMQRWLWSHDCDLAIFGHSHNSMAQVEAVEKVKGNKIVHDHRIGMYSGTFMNGARYAEVKGYFPMPLTQPHVVLRPWAEEHRDRIRVVA